MRRLALGKLWAVLYSIVFILALMARVVGCFFEALLESRCISWSFGAEVFRTRWNDDRHYLPVGEHVAIIRGFWDEQT